MDHKKISAGIVTHNNFNEIDSCLSSLIEFAKEMDIQIYVLDNASQDETVHLIKEKFPQVYVIESKDNLGFGKGHNRIVKQVESDYHMVVNPDIVFTENSVKKLYEFLEKFSNVGQITPRILNEDGTEQFLPKKDPTFKYVVLSKFPVFKHYRTDYTRANEEFKRPTRILSSTGCLFMIRTALFKRIGGFDERFFMYFEDADLSRRVRRTADIVFYPNVYVFHGWKRDNTRSLRGIRIFLTSMAKYFWKWKRA